MKIIICFQVLLIQFIALTGISAVEVEKLVIIGAGAAGSSAAIFAGQANIKPLVIQDVDCKSQIALIHKIDNYPGIVEKIDGIELLELFRTQAQIFGAKFERDSVKSVDFSERPFMIELEGGKIIFAESVIISSGATKQWLNLPNEEELKGKGVVGAAFCHSLEAFAGKKVIIVGGGHAALQEAHHVAEIASSITIVNRSDKFNASKFHQQQVFDNEKIDIVYDSEIDEILDISKDKVTGVRLRNKITSEKTYLDADIVLVAIGSKPNTDMFKDKLELSKTNQIVINGKNTSTNIPGVFAAGDVTDVSYGRVVISAGAGAMAAMDAVKFLDEQKQRIENK